MWIQHIGLKTSISLSHGLFAGSMVSSCQRGLPTSYQKHAIRLIRSTRVNGCLPPCVSSGIDWWPVCTWTLPPYVSWDWLQLTATLQQDNRCSKLKGFLSKMLLRKSWNMFFFLYLCLYTQNDLRCCAECPCDEKKHKHCLSRASSALLAGQNLSLRGLQTKTHIVQTRTCLLVSRGFYFYYVTLFSLCWFLLRSV